MLAISLLMPLAMIWNYGYYITDDDDPRAKMRPQYDADDEDEEDDERLALEQRDPLAMPEFFQDKQGNYYNAQRARVTQQEVEEAMLLYQFRNQKVSPFMNCADKH